MLGFKVGVPQFIGSSPPGTPKHINYEDVKKELEKFHGVKKAHTLHIWSLNLDKIALAAHLVLGKRKHCSLIPIICM